MGSLDYDHEQYAGYVTARVNGLNKTVSISKSSRDWLDSGQLLTFDVWRKAHGTIPLKTLNRTVEQMRPVYIPDLKERLKFVALCEFRALLLARVQDMREIEHLAREMEEEDAGFGVF